MYTRCLTHLNAEMHGREMRNFSCCMKNEKLLLNNTTIYTVYAGYRCHFFTDPFSIHPASLGTKKESIELKALTQGFELEHFYMQKVLFWAI